MYQNRAGPTLQGCLTDLHKRLLGCNQDEGNGLLTSSPRASRFLCLPSLPCFDDFLQPLQVRIQNRQAYFARAFEACQALLFLNRHSSCLFESKERTVRGLLDTHFPKSMMVFVRAGTKTYMYLSFEKNRNSYTYEHLSLQDLNMLINNFSCSVIFRRFNDRLCWKQPSRATRVFYLQTTKITIIYYMLILRCYLMQHLFDTNLTSLEDELHNQHAIMCE